MDEPIVQRLLFATGATNQISLARALGVEKGTMNKHIHARRIPEKLLRRAADTFGVSYDWLLTGEGTSKPSTVRRASYSVDVRPASTENEEASLTLNEATAAVREIYKSGNRIVIGALEHNLLAFQLTVRALRA